MKNPAWPVGLMLGLSGFAALVMQVAWLREFRLVFGSSTAASAAVLAIFMAGLGVGNAVLGRRADRLVNPLGWCAGLLLGIALSGAATPLLVDLARTLYVGLGGQLRLGLTGATAVRIVLTVAVLGAPTFLMGGVLPAAVRAVIEPGDRQRRSIGWLYGLNELGALLGAGGSTFALLESFGTRGTLWVAVVADGCAALLAFGLSRNASAVVASPAAPAVVDQPARDVDAASDHPASPLPLYATAGLLGFVFLLMELVWYRMLAPLLGGSVYTFGLILTLVLAGIALGGWAYALVARAWRPSRTALAVSIALEGLALAVPFALGDRLAIFAVLVSELRDFGFGGGVTAWTLIAAPVVLPTAIISGFQFPLLVALLGTGDHAVGRQLGNAFAWNTAGGIAGSLAGGFGLLPWLSAVGAWRAMVLTLAGLSLLLLLLSWRSRRHAGAALLAVAAAVAALIAIGSLGPTAVWRHGAIGAGRFVLVDSSPNGLRDQTNALRRATIWECEGLESSIALFADNGLSFYINGKSDGNAVEDAATQIMLSLAGALLHPDPRTALVVGLGSGESAGWLAEVESIERVEVIELEPAMAAVARACSAANRQVLDNAKVSVRYGDARELLFTAPEHYDLIVSEPSNPYRAGVATLFTREFYSALRQRLATGGLFVQWLQTYEIDGRSVRTVIATLRSVFAHVELWQSRSGDLLLVCSTEPVEHDVDRMRAGIGQAPFDAALANVWRANDVEGVLSHYLAGPRFVDAVAALPDVQLNTDDKNVLEYGLARSLGRANLFSMSELRESAARLKDDRPATRAAVDWQRVTVGQLALCVATGEAISAAVELTDEQRLRLTAHYRFRHGQWNDAVNAFGVQPFPPADLAEVRMLARAYAELGIPLAGPWIEQLTASLPTDAELISALLAARTGQPGVAVERLLASFDRLHHDPWPEDLASIGLALARELSIGDARRSRRLRAALEEPFAARLLESQRLATKLAVADELSGEAQAKDIGDFEPHVPWTRGFLRQRAAVYASTGNPLSGAAARDLQAFERDADDTAILPSEPFPAQ
jgi:spermidine synthase